MSLLEKRLAKKNKTKTKKEIIDNVPKNTPKYLTQIQKERKNIQHYKEEANLDLLELKDITFSIFSNENFARKSIVDIENPNRNLDLFSSLEDPRLGTFDSMQLCGFCEKTTEECAGHFSRINVGFNFIHPFYRSVVISVLQCICHCCNKLLIQEPVIVENNLRAKKGFERLNAFKNISKNKECKGLNCGSKVVFTSLDSSDIRNRHIDYYIVKGNEKSEIKHMPVDTVLTRLNAIRDEDVKTLGFESVHPKDFIMNYIPVIPITERPPNLTEGEKKDSGITYAYNDILSNYLESKHHYDPNKQEDCYKNIISIYSAIIVNKKNESTTYTRNQKEPIESIKDMINQKDGIIRNNLLAKRCNYTGRSVLGPSDIVNFGSLGLAKTMKTLTVPEIITRYNYKYIKELGKNGDILYLCPKKGNLAGRKLKFDYQMHFDKLYIGDRVERKLENNDVVTFNRQPTLQPQSMLGYKVKFHDKNTFGVHLSSAKGLNADFDGDEGNIHLIQTTESQVEAKMVMNVENNIISYSSSKPEAALTYNCIVSAFLMTKDETLIEKDEFLKAVEYVSERLGNGYVNKNFSSYEERCGEINPLSGKALFSILLPEDFWYQKFEEDGEVYISNGILRKGRLKSSHIGENHFSIISNLHKNYGHTITSYFISAATFLLNWYIFRNGFTLSFEDATLREYYEEYTKEKKEIIKNTNNMLKEKVKQTINSALEKEEFNRSFFQDFNNTKTAIDKLTKKYLDLNNSIFVMVNSGAKGSYDSIIQIVGCKSFISVDSNVVSKTMTNNTRWLTTFSPKDDRLESRGFACNSYYEGLDVDSYFAECQDGRLSLIAQSIKTAKVGYMQRRMVKAQEDLVINYDGSVRNQQDVIFQFSYGAGFKISEMILDKSDDQFSIFNFINVKDLVGKTNYENGLDFDIGENIKNLAEEINNKYDYKDKTPKFLDEIDEDNNEKLYINDNEEDYSDIEDVDY